MADEGVCCLCGADPMLGQWSEGCPRCAEIAGAWYATAQEPPRVHNSHHGKTPPGAVYVGRGSPFGNPFVIGVDGTRDEVCDKFETAVLNNPALIALIKTKLRGRHLVCYCKPARCHADTLLRIANE